MNLEQTIIRVILESGQNGISSRRIALHVHGELNSLFNPISIDAVTIEVRHYLQTQMKKKSSLIERVEGTHRFRINTQSINNSNYPELEFLKYENNFSDNTLSSRIDNDRELRLF